MEVFNDCQPDFSFPDAWLGVWIDQTGRFVFVQRKESQSFLVSTAPEIGKPWYQFSELNGKTRLTFRMPAKWIKKLNYTLLEIEAGTPGLGPTYCLIWIAENPQGFEKPFRITTPSNPLEIIKIQPQVFIGLYDDWEDDLGVPWAFPLKQLTKCGIEEENLVSKINSQSINSGYNERKFSENER